MWKKQDNAKTIMDVIIRNSHQTKEELFQNKIYSVKGLESVATIISDYKDKPIHIIGDYDCDGIMSSAIMKIGLTAFGCSNVSVRIPKRFSEGYGLSEKIISEISEGLIITVDNGISAVDAVKKAKEKGLTVIITDHHLPGEIIPNADILLDPHIGNFDFQDYCGAGVAYKIMEYLLPKNPILYKLLSFAAIATVADVVPLIGDNRQIVRKGLRSLRMKEGRTSGLYSLLYRLGLNEELDEHCIGFQIGPVLNAPGRLFDDGAVQSYELISFDGEWNQAITMADNLILLNDKRKQLVKEQWEETMQIIKINCMYGQSSYVIYQPGCPEGITGVLAGRLSEYFNRPAIILTDAENGTLKGSGRSSNAHLKNLLDKVNKYLLRYGGHKGAAGLSLKKEELDDFINAFTKETNILSFNDSTDIYYDLKCNASIIPKLLTSLTAAGPFGEGMKPVVFCIENFKLFPIQNNYIQTMGVDKNILKVSGNGINGIIFSRPGFDPVKKYQQLGSPHSINCIGILGFNYHNGEKSSQVEIIDFEPRYEEKPKSQLQILLEKQAAKYNK